MRSDVQTSSATPAVSRRCVSGPCVSPPLRASPTRSHALSPPTFVYVGGAGADRDRRLPLDQAERLARGCLFGIRLAVTPGEAPVPAVQILAVAVHGGVHWLDKPEAIRAHWSLASASSLPSRPNAGAHGVSTALRTAALPSAPSRTAAAAAAKTAHPAHPSALAGPCAGPHGAAQTADPQSVDSHACDRRRRRAATSSRQDQAPYPSGGPALALPMPARGRRHGQGRESGPTPTARRRQRRTAQST